MMKKIFKYDFIKINKFLSILYLLTLILSIVNLLFKSGVSDASVATFLLTTDFAFIFAAASLLFALIIPFTRFRASLFKDEAYLTHTLPIDKGKLYDAKVIVSIVSILIGMLLFGICFIYIFSHTSVTEFIIDTIKDEVNNVKVLTFCINFILRVLLLFFCAINALILANKYNKKRDFLCFLLFFLIYFIIELFEIIITSIIFDSIVITLLVNLLIVILLYISGRIMFKKGFNIE